MKKRGTALLLCLLLAVLTCACGNGGGTSDAAEDVPQAAAAQDDGIDITPHTKPDGSKYRLAYVDYDKWLPSARQFFYILKGLEELGWIAEGSIPFTIQEIEEKEYGSGDLYEKLLTVDLGDYIELSKDGFFYLDYDGEEMIGEALLAHAGKDIDLVLTMGTSAGVFVKSRNLPIPMMDFSATDPVGSEIIDSSTEGSGNPNIWAQVEPSLTARQIKYYYSIRPFTKLGTVAYQDEIMSGVPDLEASSKELGFDFTKIVIPSQPRETAEELDAYYDLVAEKIREIAAEGIDAFYLPVDLINDLDRQADLIAPLYDKGIPVFTMDDVATIHAGGLMLISANDIVNVGRFVANAMAKTLSGAEAGSLPCIYTSSPSIYVNYDVAQKIGYPLSFEFLAICDEIYTEGGQSDEQ